MYKFESPHDWLYWKVKHTQDIDELRQLITPLISSLDPDDIQNTFQNDMESDGYFDHCWVVSRNR